MTSVFVSYRREDSRHPVGRLYEHLASHFGKGEVFKDVDSIPLGVDFRRILTESVSRCDVFLAIIGDDWLSITGKDGSRRLDDPGDYVRIEIEAALNRKIPVVPVLVGNASVPKAGELPESLRELSYRNAIHVLADPDFHHDMERLIRGIEKAVPVDRRRSLRAWLGRRWVRVVSSLVLLLIVGLGGFFGFHAYFDDPCDPSRYPVVEEPVEPETPPPVDAEHPASPPDPESKYCTLTLYNDTGKPIRLWRFIPKDPADKTDASRKNSQTQWKNVLACQRETNAMLAVGGWSYIAVERLDDNLRANERPVSPDSRPALATSDKGWVFFRYGKFPIIQIKAAFFDDPTDERNFVLSYQGFSKVASERPGDRPSGQP